MIIRKIQIDNYLCYYDTNHFELSGGLNIILGGNGEGKTKFFEAVDWLFNGENQGLNMLVSAKKLDETIIGDSFTVKVSITVEQYGEKSIITKSFLAQKEKANECSTSNFMIEGIEENNAGERNQVDGSDLLERIFPFQIRKYSMFKGEADLNIFESDNALVNLIKYFSKARHYGKYSDKGELLLEKAEKAVEKSTRQDINNQRAYNTLELDISRLENEKNRLKVQLASSQNEKIRIEKNLQLAESHVNNADALETFNKRIKKYDDKISSLNSTIDENYTTSLFDEKWLLVNFESFHKEFADKVIAHSKKRRTLQSEFDTQKGKDLAVAELLNSPVPLPIGVPSKAHSEEMLSEEICKVCNREAKRGSEPYNFMMNRLKIYKESQVVDENEPKKNDELFKFQYTNRLENLSLSHEDNLRNLRLIRKEIKDRFEFNDARKNDISENEKNLENEKIGRERILESGTAEETLKAVLENYNVWQDDIKKQNSDQVGYEVELKKVETELSQKKKEKDKIDTDSANLFLINTRNILRDIQTIFRDTKEKKFDEFIDKLQTKSNKFFKTINIDSFTGEIVFTRRDQVSSTIVDLELQENGRKYHLPNTSLLTSMHISILFAIAELASEIKEENFPLIFDAPTSSFDENKAKEFLNLIFETKTQKILLIKDFLNSDNELKELSIKKEFENVKRNKAFWVKLERPFDNNDLKTMNSKVITL